MAEYDKYAIDYSNFESLNGKYAVTPSYLKLVGDLNGKSLLDIACGSGKFTRMFRDAGANPVFGTDISSKMIELAITEQKKSGNPNKITYLIYNAESMPRINSNLFDIITCSYLFHYANSKDVLLKMALNVSNNLKKGGFLYALNTNPDIPLRTNKKYGVSITGKEPIKEGDELKLIFHSKNRKIGPFKMYHWKKNTYEDTLTKAGFSEIQWNDCEVSSKGVEKYGVAFWDEYNSGSHPVIIKARKK